MVDHLMPCPECNGQRLKLTGIENTGKSVAVDFRCVDCAELSRVVIRGVANRVFYAWANPEHTKAVSERRQTKQRARK